MRDKILVFIIGLLVGAIITAGGFLIYEKNNPRATQSEETNTQTTENFDRRMPGGQRPSGEMPEGEIPEGEVPPEMPDGEAPADMQDSEQNNNEQSNSKQSRKQSRNKTTDTTNQSSDV